MYLTITSSSLHSIKCDILSSGMVLLYLDSEPIQNVK